MMDRLLTLASIPLGIGYSIRKQPTRAEWRDHLLHRMQQFVQYAYQNTEFYRTRWDEAGVKPHDIQNLDAVARLPLISRADWRNASGTEIIPRGKLLTWHNTGGTSSGTSLRVAYTASDDLQIRGRIIGNLITQSHWLQRSLLRFQPPDLQKPGGTSYFRLIQNVASDASVDVRLQALIDQPERMVISYPMPLWRAVVEAYRRKINLKPRDYVQIGGEVMTDSVRRMLVRQLGVPVFQGYAATDYGSMAGECLHHHLHIVPDKTLVEIVDGEEPAQPGQWGEVVVTNFFSHGRPLIRVRTGDRAMWGGSQCPCGSPLPYIQYVAGRLEDHVLKPDGTRILWPDVENALRPCSDQVFGYQMEQVDRDRVTARLSVAKTASVSGLLEELLGDVFAGMSVNIAFTDDIRQAANGKTRTMIGIQNPETIPTQLPKERL